MCQILFFLTFSLIYVHNAKKEEEYLFIRLDKQNNIYLISLFLYLCPEQPP